MKIVRLIYLCTDKPFKDVPCFPGNVSPIKPMCTFLLTCNHQIIELTSLIFVTGLFLLVYLDLFNEELYFNIPLLLFYHNTDAS